MLFFRKSTRQAGAVIAAFHAAFGRLQTPDDALAEAAFSALVRQVFRRHGATGYETLPARAVRELALMLVLVHDGRPSFDRALVAHGIAADDLVRLRERAEASLERREQARLALRTALSEARSRRAAAKVAEARFAARAAGQPKSLPNPVPASPAVPVAVAQTPIQIADSPRLAA